MPGKRETYGLDACTNYTLRLCDKNDPCEYHKVQAEARAQNLSLETYLYIQRKDNGKGQR